MIREDGRAYDLGGCIVDFIAPEDTRFLKNIPMYKSLFLELMT